uniref:Uncharacterized protein n=1 Tax=Meloidogyne floridensis TaxID=298350 RepID=A0A915NUD9_9BILA
MPFTTQSNKDLQLKRNEAKRKRTEKAEKAAAQSALVRADRVKQRTQLLQTDDSSNLDLDNYNENRVDDDLMEGCSSNFEIPSLAIPSSLADSQQMLLQRLKESQKLLKQNSISLPDFSSMFTFAETTEGLLILSSKLGSSLINKQYEFRNIVDGLNCEEIKNEEEMRNAILVHHTKAIILLKAKWDQVRWIKLGG